MSQGPLDRPLTFVVSGVPVPWARAGRRTKSASGKPLAKPVTYTPAAVAAYQRKVRAAALQAMAGAEPWDGPVAIALNFRLPRRQLKVDPHPDQHLWAPYKPDLDNLAKGVLDALKGAAWTDDDLVVRMTLFKVYGARGEEPGLDVHIEPLLTAGP